MNYKLATILLLLFSIFIAVLITLNNQPPSAILVNKINVKGFGTWTGLRLGDLNGDNRLDFVLAQNKEGQISCITAIDIDGNILWQSGNPNPSNYKATYDLPLQIYDINEDGLNEVICIMGNKLTILNGKDGMLIKQTELPGSDFYNSIAIANFSGGPYPKDILIKNRYNKVWSLDHNLNIIWSFSGNTGHFPWPNDFDNDGRDELMCGYTLLNFDGTVRWEVELPGHSDGVAIDNIDGDLNDSQEIAIACCDGNTFAVLNDLGEILWKHSCGHSQHIITGNFLPELPGREVCGLDRGNDRSTSGVDAMIMYSAEGKQLWREKRTDSGSNRWLSMITTVTNWDNNPGDLILGYRRGGTTPPALYDGYGKKVVMFPFPNPEEQHFAQHADIFGDEREEIVIWNQTHIYIYKNGMQNTKAKTPTSRPQIKRLYNYTHYIGMT